MTRRQWLEKQIADLQDEGVLSDRKLMKLMEYEDELEELRMQHNKEDDEE